MNFREVQLQPQGWDVAPTSIQSRRAAKGSNLRTALKISGPLVSRPTPASALASALASFFCELWSFLIGTTGLEQGEQTPRTETTRL